MDSIPRLLQGIAAAHGLEVDVDYQQEYPLTITDEDETHTAENVITECSAIPGSPAGPLP
jgi:metal-dependent amidase/aminoacylase/carboxypeptidase family protein